MFSKKHDEFYYYYIGKHKYLNWRILEHAANIRAGLYTVLDLEKIDVTKHLGDQSLTEEDKKNLMPYIPGNYQNFKNLLTRSDTIDHSSITELQDKMINSFRFMFGTHDSFEGPDSGKNRETAERTVITELNGQVRRPGARCGDFDPEMYDASGFWEKARLNSKAWM